MIIKQCLLVLLAIFLVMGCVGAVSADDTPINNVAISVTEPKTGEAPQLSLTWDNATGTIVWTPSGAKFAPGTAYTATITVTANNNYNFTESVNVRVNDKSIDPTILTNKSFTVSQTFESTDKITLDLVNVTITAPRTGEPPATSATSDTTGVGTPSVSWDPNNSPFNSNINYTATITVSASDGFQFDSSTSATVNGQPATSVTLVSASSLSITYSGFPKTTPIEISSPIILTLTQPATGNTATSPSSTTTGVGTPTVVWSPTVSSTFVEGQAYYANITIPVASTNYKFASSPAVTLNGGDVSSEIVRTDTQLILNHSFDATALKTRIDSVTITGVTAPVYGATPVTSVTPSTTGISSVAVTWNSTPATFAANTPYTATIIAKTSSGYMFSTSTPSVSLNGARASTTNVTRTSDTQITITYTFPKTASATLPTAVLSMNPASGTGTVPLTVKFSYTLSNFDNCILTYGDGSSIALTSSSGSLTHKYPSVGSYTATLTAKNTNGTTTDNKTITVKKVGLVAGFQTNPTTLSGTIPFTVKFTDSSLGTIKSRTWDFGDGTTDSVTQNPTHTYNTVGSYKVTLTIGDGTDTDYTYKTITVTSPVTATTTSTSNVSSLGAITLGNLLIPGPFDIIKEFLNLFYALLNSDNYLFLNNTTT